MATSPLRNAAHPSSWSAAAKVDVVCTAGDAVMPKKLTIFVHRASEYLTDHESHGEGLICFSLLKGLAERGHRIYAYTNRAAIREMPEGLTVRSERQRVPANSLAPWEHSWRASRWLRQLIQEQPIDLVWHMNPMGGSGCPRPPQTFGKPLVIGPLYYAWPKTPGVKPTTGRPRLGIGLQSVIGPIAEAGWKKTLVRSSALFCATKPHADAMQQQLPQVCVSHLPLIVEPPQGAGPRQPYKADKALTLLFVAHLSPNKNAMLFCETIKCLLEEGIQTQGVMLGDGPERTRLERFCTLNNLAQAICFKGKVPNNEVYSLVREADFLVSTSFAEPYGRGIAEAMSVGTPCVCHHSGGPADFITNRVDGLLVDELSGHAYADAIQRVLSATGNWNTLSNNAQRTAAGWHSEVVMTKLEKQLYAALR